MLLVEDMDDVRDLTAMLVSAFGHEVHTAADGTLGLEALLDQDPDVGLVDLGLPGIDGWEVARRAREAGLTSVLIAVTGYGSPEDVRRAYEAGFDLHLTKPVDAPRLRHLLALDLDDLRNVRYEVE